MRSGMNYTLYNTKESTNDNSSVADDMNVPEDMVNGYLEDLSNIANSVKKKVQKEESNIEKQVEQTIQEVKDKTSANNRTSVSSYTGNITPDANTIFVFGSNPQGRHGAGAAKVAREQFGAIYGQGEGLQGNAYALPTKDLRVKKNNSLRSISPEQIIESIKKLYETARQNPDKQFKVAYRNTDKASLNGYTGLEMIDMFLKAGPIPANIVFSKEWVDTGKFDRSSNQNLFSDDVTVNDAMNNNEKDEQDNVKKYCEGE